MTRMSYRRCVGLDRTAASPRGSVRSPTMPSTYPAVTIGELQNGIEKLRGIDDVRANQLETWVDSVVPAFDIVAVDERSFRRWARLMRKRPPVLWRDALIAATALVHGFTVVTRNTKDFVDFGVPFLDPFTPP